MQEMQKRTLGEQDGETSEGMTHSSIIVGESSPNLHRPIDIHERKYLKRLEQEEVAQSLALERRERNFENMKAINAVNKSLQFEQNRMLKDFKK